MPDMAQIFCPSYLLIILRTLGVSRFYIFDLFSDVSHQVISTDALERLSKSTYYFVVLESPPQVHPSIFSCPAVNRIWQIIMINHSPKILDDMESIGFHLMVCLFIYSKLETQQGLRKENDLFTLHQLFLEIED
ncbi:hypothetical protein RF11_08799 [Thelohanellus kitauei]|uniref:Uncharacterized protein n=1 Tax=Thelohanellus kitauei TaxID=669202 RepID=A0A0C2IF76_THEKT|nr:hypothetical protein RF11_08799 [Thelohanellus kitauei]